jgi:hypothetical protein
MDRETHERVIDAELIDAALVKPDPGFSSIFSLEAISPELDSVPFIVARVLPTVGDERIDISEGPGRGTLEEKRVRLVLCELLPGDLVERHVAEKLRRFLLGLLDAVVADGSRHGSGKKPRLPAAA